MSWGQVALPLCSALVGHVGRAGTSSGLPSTREAWTYWSEPSEGDEEVEESAVQVETE